MSELRDKLEKKNVQEAAKEVEELGLDPRAMLRLSSAVGAFFALVWWTFLAWMASHVGLAALIIVGVYILWRATALIRGAMHIEDTLEALEATK